MSSDDTAETSSSEPAKVTSIRQRLAKTATRLTKQTTPRPLMRIICTHVKMERIHAAQPCDLCGRPPSMGWLYTCREDRSQAALLEPKSPFEGNPTLHELYDLGFGTSILRQALEGRYTDEQLTLLKSQRIRVQNVLEEQKRVSASTVEEQEDQSLHPNVTVRKRKNGKNKKVQLWLQRPGADPARCELKCCHTCRPYYRDRIFSSLAGIVQDLEAAYSGTSFIGVKLMDAAIVRQLGLRLPNNDEGVLSFDSILRHFETSRSETDSSTSPGDGTSLQDTTGPRIIDDAVENPRNPEDRGELQRPTSRSSTRSSTSQFLSRLKEVGRSSLQKLKRSRSSPPSTSYESARSDLSVEQPDAPEAQEAQQERPMQSENARPTALEGNLALKDLLAARSHGVDLREPDNVVQVSGDSKAFLEDAESRETAAAVHVPDSKTQV